MAKKKALNKKSFQGIILTIVIVLLSLAVLGATALPNVFKRFGTKVVTVNGESVSKGYFEYCLTDLKISYEKYMGSTVWFDESGSSAQMVSNIKNSVANQLITYVACRQEAVRRGIVLSDEDKADIDKTVADKMGTAPVSSEEAADENTAVSMAYTPEEIKEYGIKEKYVRESATDAKYYEKLRENVESQYEFNEADYDAYFDEYKTSNEMNETKMDVDIISFMDEASANDVKKQIDDGLDFIEALKQNSLSYDSSQEYQSTIIDSSTSVNMPTEIVGTAFDTPEGGISAPFSITNSTGETEAETFTYYCILRVNSKTPPDWEQLKADKKEPYISEQKTTRFNELVKSLTDTETEGSEVKVDVNDVLLSYMRIKGIPDVNPEPTKSPIEQLGLPSLDSIMPTETPALDDLETPEVQVQDDNVSEIPETEIQE